MKNIILALFLFFTAPVLSQDINKNADYLTQSLLKTYSTKKENLNKADKPTIDTRVITSIQSISKNGGSLTACDGVTWTFGWRARWTTYLWEKGHELRVVCANSRFYLENLDLKEKVAASFQEINPVDSMTVSTISNPKPTEHLFHLANGCSLRLPSGRWHEHLHWQKNDIVMLCHGESQHQLYVWNLNAQAFQICTLQCPSGVTDFELGNLLNLEEDLNKVIIGQGTATNMVVNSLFRYTVGIRTKNAPIASFLFLGPTGTGKTELSKQLCKRISPLAPLVRFNMGEFSSEHSDQRLIGSPPGYINHSEGGQLTNAILENPCSIVLIDEFEKAHDKVRKVFLTILDEGYMRTPQNDYVDFTKCIFIFTSNMRAQDIYNLAMAGKTDLEIFQNIEPSLMESLSPELYNRLTPVLFHPLEASTIRTIATHHLKLLQSTISEKTGILCHFGQDFIYRTALEGYSPQLGARPLQRLIDGKIIPFIAKTILQRHLQRGDSLYISYDQEGNLMANSVILPR